MAVTVHNEAGWLLPVDSRALARLVGVMAQAAGEDAMPVSLHIVRDVRIAQENQGHMGCQGPTNVLSFPGVDGMPGILLLSADTLHRECLLYGQWPEEHLIRLLAHGLAHLCGLDHGPTMDALCQQMETAGWAAHEASL